MGLTAQQLANVKLIDRERQSIANAGIGVAGRVAKTAYLHARAALKLGHDPVQAAKDVLLGNRKIGQPGLVPILTRMLVVSDLQGRRRSQLNAPQAIQLSRESDEQRRKRERLLLLLLLTEDDADTIAQTYTPIAANLVNTAVSPLMNRIGGTAQSAVQRQQGTQSPTVQPPGMKQYEPSPFGNGKTVGGDEPDSVPNLIRELASQFARAGFLPEVNDAPAIARIFDTGSVKAYEMGRWNGWQTPQIKDALWGLHYSAVLDDRTTLLCRALDGMVAPIDDPVWQQWTPPNHFNCRSTLIEVWKSPSLSRPSIIEPDASQDDLERFRKIRDDFRKYFR